MEERPILFSTEMIQAILDNRKTQTRRIIKPKSKKALNFKVCRRVIDNGVYEIIEVDEDENEIGQLDCPYGKVGDILWVRETWGIRVGMIKRNGCELDNKEIYLYKADWSEFHQLKGWKPSIHMPKEVCRIKLKITDINVERLQKITAGDIVKEGFNNEMPLIIGTAEFINFWNKLNSKRGYSWESNPYVFVISFERLNNDI